MVLEWLTYDHKVAIRVLSFLQIELRPQGVYVMFCKVHNPPLTVVLMGVSTRKVFKVTLGYEP